MRRTYNNNISARANQSLQRRACIVRLEKSILACAIILFLSLCIILGSSVRTLANAHSAKTMNKYYTSIQIESGDTLWNIAEQYSVRGIASQEEIMNEICEINRISKDDILHSSEYIVVPYYSTEEK